MSTPATNLLAAATLVTSVSNKEPIQYENRSISLLAKAKGVILFFALAVGGLVPMVGSAQNYQDANAYQTTTSELIGIVQSVQPYTEEMAQQDQSHQGGVKEKTKKIGRFLKGLVAPVAGAGVGAFLTRNVNSPVVRGGAIVGGAVAGREIDKAMQNRSNNAPDNANRSRVNLGNWQGNIRTVSVIPPPEQKSLVTFQVSYADGQSELFQILQSAESTRNLEFGDTIKVVATNDPKTGKSFSVAEEIPSPSASPSRKRKMGRGS